MQSKTDLKDYALLSVSVLFVAVMILIDSSGQFTYFGRSFIKVILFGIIPFLYLLKSKAALPSLKKEKSFGTVLIFSFIAVFLILVSAWFLDYYGFLNSVKTSLSNKVGVSRHNYPFVFIYIVLINGPLEEFFFRYILLKTSGSDRKLISSILFSIYHIGMLYTMFHPVLFIIAVLGLATIGLVFIRLNQSGGSLLNSITLHMAANFAINTVGWFLIMQN